MNKLDFLRRLDRELSALDQTERRELLAFYEERFYNGTIYENKTEEQVVAELESPEVIARNILSEYGISSREARGYNQSRKPLPGNYNNERRRPQKEKRQQPRQNSYQTEEYFEPNNNRSHRSQGISTSKLIWLLIVDVFILSWAIPSLFSVTASLGASLLSYIGVLGFLASGVIYDQMIFWFLTGAYVLLFLFTLVVLELFIWTCKKTILWHMKVFKYKKLNIWNKKLSRIGVEAWFKRHRLLRFIKSVSGVAAIVVMTYTGFYLYAHYGEIKELYIDQEVIVDVESVNVESDILASEGWIIEGIIDNTDVEIIPSTGDEIVVTRTYREDSEAVYNVTVDEATNKIKVVHDAKNSFINFTISLEDILQFIHKEEIVVEVPMELYLDLVDVTTLNGEINLYNLDVDEVDVQSSNGRVELSYLRVDGNVTMKSSNGVLIVKDSTGADKLSMTTDNGTIKIDDSSFKDYVLNTGNGSIKLTSLNKTNLDGVSLFAETGNGSHTYEDVFVASVEAISGNGSIEFYNDDEIIFDVDFDHDTGLGSVDTNVD